MKNVLLKKSFFIKLILIFVFLTTAFVGVCFCIGQDSKQVKAEVLDNLEFVLLDGGEAYSVKVNKSNKPVGEFVIPSEFNGKPVVAIEDYGFSFCSNLTTIIIPDTITAISSHAFDNCIRLQSITIPDSVNYIDVFAFSWCRNIRSVTYSTTGEDWSFVNGLLTLENKDYWYSVWVYNGIAPLVLSVDWQDNGSNVTCIPYDMFSSFTNLLNIELPENLELIEEYAFSLCTSLSSITFPNSLKTIEGYAFSYCFNLGDVKFNYGLETIGEYAFNSCFELTNVFLPETITSVGLFAFEDEEITTTTTSITLNPHSLQTPFYLPRYNWNCNEEWYYGDMQIETRVYNENYDEEFVAITSETFDGVDYYIELRREAYTPHLIQFKDEDETLLETFSVSRMPEYFPKEKQDHIFDGWYLDLKYLQKAPEQETELTTDLVVYSKWSNNADDNKNSSNLTSVIIISSIGGCVVIATLTYIITRTKLFHHKKKRKAININYFKNNH